ncbi:carbamoyl-phosphate synthase subunit L [Alicycliphilus sp. B1]|nr:carbamoyl-phosphate synthase subunit L [Alicycliphilus sp. B1]
MFNKILIANRGEIACRVAATARRMGVKTVAVYSDADAQAKHVAACDEAVHIGASAPKDSYLRWERIIEAAKATGAQAIHPGYGFLSENEDFAKACQSAGLVFIGPPASAISAMGLKAESKRLMAKAGVPLVPGYQGEDQDPQLLQREADAIGYPVLIKASAGGGGKGMRLVEKSEDFAAALASVPARGHQQLRQRRGAGREIRAAPAPHRDPGVRRHAGQLRLPVRARLLRAAAPPEGAGGGPRTGHDAAAAPEDGRGRGGRSQGRGLRGRGHGGVHRRAAGRLRPARGHEVLFHGDEHPSAGGASGDRGHHGRGPGGMATARGQRPAAAEAPGRAEDHRPRHRGAHLRREPRQQLPARHGPARRVPQARLHQL